jgi:hypothetical protein
MCSPRPQKLPEAPTYAVSDGRGPFVTPIDTGPLRLL